MSSGKIFKILELKILRECLWVQLELSTLTGAEECRCQWITWVHHFQVPCLTWVTHQLHLTLLVGVFSHKIHLCPQDTWCQEFLGISFRAIWFLWERNVYMSDCISTFAPIIFFVPLKFKRICSLWTLWLYLSNLVIDEYYLMFTSLVNSLISI